MIPKTRRFTKDSAKIAKQSQIKNNLDHQIIALVKENLFTINTMNHYKDKYEKTLQELNKFKEANGFLTNLYLQYPYLFKHLCSLNLCEDNGNA